MRKATTLQLTVHGPFTLCAEDLDVLGDCPMSHEAGIYLFTVKQESGKFAISYVGQTGRSFYKRANEHIIQTLGGNYQVCDPDDMKRGKQTVVWNGLRRKGTRDRLPNFLKNYVKLAPTIRASLVVTNVFLLPYEGDRRVRQRIEGGMASTLIDHPPASRLLPDDIRYYRQKEDEEPIHVEINGTQLLIGLPQYIDV